MAVCVHTHAACFTGSMPLSSNTINISHSFNLVEINCLCLKKELTQECKYPQSCSNVTFVDISSYISKHFSAWINLGYYFCFFPFKSFVKIKVNCTQTIANPMFRTFLTLIFITEVCQHQHLWPVRKTSGLYPTLPISSKITFKKYFGFHLFYFFIHMVHTGQTVSNAFEDT